MSWESPYFSSEEMKCSHTGLEEMDAAFMEKLTELRAAYAKPMQVTSAFRHPTHPIEAKKPGGKGGTHSTGRAVDIAVDRGEAWELLHLAMAMGFTGIGVQQKGGGRFLHLDNLTADEGFTRPTVWSY